MSRSRARRSSLAGRLSMGRNKALVERGKHMATIVMTEDETETYDNGTEEQQTRLMRELRDRAREIGGTVEIHTLDGIVADVVQ
mgnify:CR=1 FL=1